jgi:hypothetical protein
MYVIIDGDVIHAYLGYNSITIKGKFWALHQGLLMFTWTPVYCEIYKKDIKKLSESKVKSTDVAEHGMH